MKYHILSIGIAKHLNARSLQYADRDAQDFYELFRRNVSNIGSEQLLLDSEATLGGIRAAFGAEELQRADADDVFFFFFSGHGTVAEYKDEASHYLVTYDATGNYATSCLSVDYLKQALKDIPCKNQFVFIDSCFSGAMSKGAKFLAGPAVKSPAAVKKLIDVIPGQGKVVLTACKDTEVALELPELRHGLFTYSVLEELQKNRNGEDYPIGELFDPIVQTVAKHAKEHSRIQTPTVSQQLVGSVRLPVFKPPLEVSPELLETPRFPELQEEAFTPPKITLSDKKQEAMLNDLVVLVRRSASTTGMPDFKRYVWQLIDSLKQSWEPIFTETTTVQDIPDAISKFEGHAFQCLALGGVLALYGTDSQITEYSEAVISLLELSEGRAGLVAVISIPKIVILLATYIMGIVGLDYRDIRALRLFLGTHVIEQYSENDPAPLGVYYKWHYLDSLGGAATKAADHVRNVIGEYQWLKQLAPRTMDKSTDIQLQVNLLLYMQYSARNVSFWPDFGRFHAERVRPLIERLKFDTQLIEQVAALLGVPKADLRLKMRDYLIAGRQRGLDSYWWESIGPDDLLNAAERKSIKTE